ncbi:SpoIIE family protein phosphatase, partial [Streptomyces sp. NPDC056295]|uniref:SpoIIE family protein phosphatase n=1 Tax=Streptomyces sp. NPDC056295 TaxID=3345774 RepID=UPI0035E06188
AGHQAIGPWGVGAWAGFPIVTSDGQAIGTMCVIDAGPRRWKPEELETLAVLARAVSNEINLRISLSTARNALKIARSALATSQDLARSLQDSLLPPVLRPVPGLDASARYLPATGDVEVVGDFYDLFHARGPWWTAVMGDVCGKGTEAAKVTALARYTLRAAAVYNPDPAAVLTNLNTVLNHEYQGTDPRFCTVVFGLLTPDPDRGGFHITLASGGHPP